MAKNKKSQMRTIIILILAIAFIFVVWIVLRNVMKKTLG